MVQSKVLHTDRHSFLQADLVSIFCFSERLNHHIDGGNLLSPSPAATSRGSSTGGTKNRTGSWSRTQNPKTSVGTGDIGDIQVVEEVRRQPSKRKSSVTVTLDSQNISRRRR